MTAPLVWIMRELRRINFIEYDTFDASCHYMNGPARRVAAQLGWITPALCRAYNFEDLLKLSRICHDKTQEFRRFFDLPLQLYAFRNAY